MIDPETRLADFRAVFAQIVVARAGCPHNAAVMRAFAAVPRHVFLGPGRWPIAEDGSLTVSDDPAAAYQDIGIGLAPGIPTGLPSLHASLLDAVQVNRGERVLQVGAGTGYFTAILAELVGPSGRICAFEIDEVLAERAQRNLAAWPWAGVEARSGVSETGSQFDAIYVNAGVQQIPRAWLDALAPGGRLLFPLVAANGAGAVFIVSRRGDRFAARFVSRARFVACIGAEDTDAVARLDRAFTTAACEAVRSLRVAPEPPDDTAWFAGSDWWLSTRAAMT
jgi:protein-L-isoaspartate(D-aspartate) O-methyltransferase